MPKQGAGTMAGQLVITSTLQRERAALDTLRPILSGRCYAGV
ncbi:hypothetical protein [Pseudomonas syringae]|nr:hypothetical protein [Pseudomonas syringae]